MKIWIAGAKGMLGSHFTRLLQLRGIEFIGTDLAHIDHILDITRLEDVLAFVAQNKITHIINCAAYTQVDKAESERILSHLVNALGPKNLAIASKKLNVQVVHFSTDYIFDGLGKIPYEENHPCNPVNYYGYSKWEGEQQLLKHSEKYCIIRTSWLYGFPGKNFVETMLRLMQEKEILRIVSDQIGCPTYCQDLVEATLLLLNHQGIYNFANSQETSWYDFAKEIHRQGLALGFPLTVKEILPITTKEYPTPAKRPAYSTLSTKKIQQELGINPRNWKIALADYMNLYQQSLQKV